MRREAYRRKCGGFVIGGYGALLRRYAWRPTDAPGHPFVPPAYRRTMTPLSTRLLANMRRGRVYTSANLTRIHRVEADAVAHALAELVGKGVLRECLNSRKLPGYCLAGSNPAPAQSQAVSGEVATPAVTRRLDGVLRGYETELATRRALAMLARR
ncbi:hypothetical protein [Paraburkholderia sp. B3]|uniref:hypothetical protein n=1 Tax=Paraburkholderia sp. B3 TaxID=3134791 RepID=UPI0039824567